MSPTPPAPTADASGRRLVAGGDPTRHAPAAARERREPDQGRDVALELLRGLAVVILVVNHIHRVHFDKRSLDPARLATMVSFTAAAYLMFRGMGSRGERSIGRLLIPLGRNSFYVFLVQVFICLGVASVPALAEDGIGKVSNTAAQVAALALIWLMVQRRFLFRWIPR